MDKEKGALSIQSHVDISQTFSKIWFWRSIELKKDFWCPGVVLYTAILQIPGKSMQGEADVDYVGMLT